MASEGKIVKARGNRCICRKEGKTVEGTLKVHRDGYGFLIPDDSSETDVFIPARHMNFALEGDKVLASYFSKAGERRREGKVLQVLKRGRERWIGELVKKGRGYFVSARDLPPGVDIFIPPALLMGARLNQVVVADITHYPEPGRPMRGRIVEVLGERDVEDTAVAAILVRHGIPRSFPGDVEEEAKRLPGEIPEEEIRRRVDLRSKPFLTIDGIRARDFDDAVCVEQHGAMTHLYVSIADVAHYVRPGSAIDQEALSRGTSVYFPDFAVPMLPERLSNDLCSLKPGEDRLTLTSEIVLDRSGKMLSAFYYESVIRSQKRGVYEEIQNFFDGDQYPEETDSPELKKSLNDMRKLAVSLMAERSKRGALDFDLPEAEIIYDHAGEVTAIVQAKRFFSHRLIEEFMISANIAVASLFFHNGVPLLYRVHDFPDPGKLDVFFNFVRNSGIKIPKLAFQKPKDFAKLLETIRGNPLEALVHQILLRSMKLAIYDPDNRGHFGLSLDNYCHFTSPIRRYPDLIVHRQLKFLLHKNASAHGRKMHFELSEEKHKPHKRGGKLSSGNGACYNFSDMASFAKSTSKREREATEAEREMVDLKRALFMQNHLHEKFFGTIRRITKFGMFVELEPHYVEGLLHVSELTDDYYQFDEKRFCLTGRKRKNKKYKIGDKIWVLVKDVLLENSMTLLSLP